MVVGTHGNAGAAVGRLDGEIVGEGAAARAQLLPSVPAYPPHTFKGSSW
jgi:hypothetical protein